ncbi:MAG: hypothetical protein LAO19_21025 [Acidobacteriia bacterium]|nr:hypothetical protein [Terriglobia bacterium]
MIYSGGASRKSHLVAGTLTHGERALAEIGLLQRYERPLPVLNDYDQLLGTCPERGDAAVRP